MSKQELILTVILFVLWLESSMLLALLFDYIEIKWKERKLKKRAKACVRKIINNQFKNELKELRK